MEDIDEQIIVLHEAGGHHWLIKAHNRLGACINIQDLVQIQISKSIALGIHHHDL